jgi:hypothetical protein
MSAESTSSAEREQRFNDVVAAYLEAVEAGQPEDREELLARYPDLASEFARFFADQDRLAFLANPLRSLVEGRPAGVPPASAEANGGPGPETELGVLGDFRLVREVGRGGMGVVFEAEQISLRRRVALKVLPLAATLDARRLQRFQNEARAAACLHHTNIVPVFAVGREQGISFYAMQLSSRARPSPR